MTARRLIAVTSIGAAALFGSCRRAPATSPSTSASDGGEASSSDGAAATPAARPSKVECEALWSRYHALIPDDPWSTGPEFVARCQASERAVLGCFDRARTEVLELLHKGEGDAGAGTDAAPEPRLEPMLLRIGMPSRFGVCVARERVRAALHSGELAGLAAAASSGALRSGEHGVAVASGVSQSLPSLGMVETEHHAELGPAGELRIARRPDGRIWIYVLGALLGRHQNQIGFLFSSGPFATGDFSGSGQEREVCIEPASDDGPPNGGAPPKRYMLSCFSVIAPLAPGLLEVGSAPD